LLLINFKTSNWKRSDFKVVDSWGGRTSQMRSIRAMLTHLQIYLITNIDSS